jgi:hypothetical protein
MILTMKYPSVSLATVPATPTISISYRMFSSKLIQPKPDRTLELLNVENVNILRNRLPVPIPVRY